MCHIISLVSLDCANAMAKSQRGKIQSQTDVMTWDENDMKMMHGKMLKGIKLNKTGKAGIEDREKKKHRYKRLA